MGIHGQDIIILIILYGVCLGMLLLHAQMFTNLDPKDIEHHDDDRSEEHSHQECDEHGILDADQGGDRTGEQRDKRDDEPEDDAKDPLGAL